jgi:hypothetical protein
MKPLAQTCKPREEVLEGALSENIFAADLTPVVNGTAPSVYGDAAAFFDNTYPTKGLQSLAREVFTRLAGRGGNPLIRLETTFGGGKTHGLIALYHLACQSQDAPEELLDIGLRPDSPVSVAAISGDSFGIEGRDHDGTVVHTLWGEMAWQLGGPEAYAHLAESDEQGLAPSADTLGRIIEGRPVLVMLDEIGRYLRVAQQRVLPGGGTVADQVTAFLQSLVTAAATNPQAVVIITLTEAQDAYAEENERVRAEIQEAGRILDEARKIAARQELVLRPTQDDEVAHVVVKRLFSHVDRDAAAATARVYHEAYQTAMDMHEADLPPRVSKPSYRDEVERTYPFDPALLSTLMTKTATIPEFQRTRGALRLLARLVRTVWEQDGADSYLIHASDFDFADEQTRNELTSRLGAARAELTPVIQADIYSPDDDAHAQEIDSDLQARDKPPLGAWLSKVIFLHSLTHGKPGQAAKHDILLACARPDQDTHLLEETLERLVEKCWYLHTDEHSFWFSKEVNVNKVIDEQYAQIEQKDAKKECRERIRTIYGGGHLQSVFYPERPADVDDDAQRIKLCIMHFDFASMTSGQPIPANVRKIYRHSGTQESFRIHQNALLFLLADDSQLRQMVNAARMHLALDNILKKSDLHTSLNDTDIKTLHDRKANAEMDMRVAIARAYRHLLVPNPDGASDDSGLQAVILDIEQAAKLEREGRAGRSHQEKVIMDALVEQDKLMSAEGKPPAPGLVIDIAWPKGQSVMTTEELQKAFRRKPRLPMLLDPLKLRGTVVAGVTEERWVYYDSTQNGGRIYTRYTAGLTEQQVLFDAAHELWTPAEANARGYCSKCGYKPCRCRPAVPTCPQCREPQDECHCPTCPTCGKKPWECTCDRTKPQQFSSDFISPQRAFAEMQDWVADHKIERLEWLQIEVRDRGIDLQQAWTGMTYFVELTSIDVTFEGSIELAPTAPAQGGGQKGSDRIALDFAGSGQNYQRAYDFFHALAREQEGVQFVAIFRANLPAPLAPAAGEISDLRRRFADGDVQQIKLRAGAPREGASEEGA